MRSGNLFVISGPSGVGKGTLVSYVMQAIPDAWMSISATTRAPRESDIDGVTYHFKTVDEFKELIDNDDFLEWAQYSGNFYGTPRAAVEEQMGLGKQVILEIEYQGAFQVREHLPEARLVFIEPPSFEVLEQRLRDRATEDEETIQRRLETAKLELSQASEYDYILVNDDLETAKEEIVSLINDIANGIRG